MDLNLKTETSSFLSILWDEISKLNQDYSELSIVLPSNRAITQLKEIVKSTAGNTILPQFESLASFASKFIDSIQATELEQLCILYDCFKSIHPNYQRDFQDFSGIGQTILSDFNEVDLALADPEMVFKNLAELKDLDNWGDGELSLGQHNFNDFWQKLGLLHKLFNQKLKEKNLHYTGQKFRQLSSISQQNNSYTVFAGFNILSNAEQAFISKFLDNGKLIFEVDYSFSDIKDHESNAKFPAIFNKDRDSIISNKWILHKPEMVCLSYQHNGEQIQGLFEQLKTLSPEELNNTAVLASEPEIVSQLIDLWPSEIAKANFTAGKKLSELSAFSLLKQIEAAWRTIDLQSIEWDLFAPLLFAPNTKRNKELDQLVIQYKSGRIAIDQIYDFRQFHGANLFHQLLTEPLVNWKDVILNTDFGKGELALFLKDSFLEILEETLNTIEKHSAIKNFSSYTIYRWVLSQVGAINLPVEGKTSEGVQVMGPLEIRNLDYENIFILSANEGVFPARITDKTLITNDLRAFFKLPGFRQKEQIYGYYFYRLFYRCKRAFIFSATTEGPIDNASPSRYVKQLQVEYGKGKLPVILLKGKKEKNYGDAEDIVVSEKIITELKEFLKLRRLSASSINTLMACPKDFYLSYVRRIPEIKEWGKPANNDLGSVFHDTLEDSYKEFFKGKDSFMLAHHLKEIEPLAYKILEEHLKKLFPNEHRGQGNMFLYQHILKRNLENWFKAEKKLLKAKPELLITGIETKLTGKKDIELFDEIIPLTFVGKLDRVQEYQGKTAVVDYKTGKVDPKDLVMKSGLGLKPKSIAFQLYFYKFLYQICENKEVDASIFSLINHRYVFQSLELNQSAGTADYWEDIQTLIKTKIEESFVLGEVLAHEKGSLYCDFCQ